MLGEPNAGKDKKETEIEEARQSQNTRQRGGGGGSLPFSLDSDEWKDGPEGLKIWDVVEGDGEVCPENATPEMRYYRLAY